MSRRGMIGKSPIVANGPWNTSCQRIHQCYFLQDYTPPSSSALREKEINRQVYYKLDACSHIRIHSVNCTSIASLLLKNNMVLYQLNFY